MNTFPQPLTSADCDLRDFQFMPLDVVRLRDSDISAVSTGDEFRSAVLLWCASWHQVPAASLPDDDIVLSQLAGFGRVVKEWRKVKEGALRGWIKCSDGRLYHPVVAEKANESWQSKVKHHYEKLLDRTRKENKKRESEGKKQLPVLTVEDWISIGMPASFPEVFQRKVKPIPAESNNDSGGNPAENALKGEVRDRDIYIKPSSQVSDREKSSGGKSGETPDPPTEPAHWVLHINATYGTEYDHKTTAGRKGIWPVLTTWCKHGVTKDQLDKAWKRALQESTEPILNYILYVDRVMETMQRPEKAPVKWWTTLEGVSVKLKELEMPSRPGESMQATIQRINTEIDRMAKS